MSRASCRPTAIMRLCVYCASLVCAAALLAFATKVYAQSSGEPVLVVNQVAPGGQLRFQGYAFPAGQGCTVQIMLSENTPLDIGPLQSDRAARSRRPPLRCLRRWHLVPILCNVWLRSARHQWPAQI